MKKSLLIVGMGCLMMAFGAAGCSSKPSDDESKQLSELKAEVASLEKEISAREADKSALLKSIADKDGQIASCNKDKEAIQQRIKGM